MSKKRIEAQVSNSDSSGCYVVPKYVSEYLQSGYFRTTGQFSLNALIGLSLSTDGEHPSLLDDKEGQFYIERQDADVKVVSIIEDIDEKLRNRKKLSEEDEAFLASLAGKLRDIRKESHKQDNEKKSFSLSAADCLSIFRQAIHAGDREDVIDQLFCMFQKQLDKCEDQNPSLSRLEAFDLHQDAIFQNIRNITIKACRAWIDMIGEKGFPPNIDPAEHKDYTGKEDFFNAVIAACQDDKTWASILFMLKERFYLAEKIKIGEIGEIETINLEDSDEMSNREVETAEETGKEHWQVKVDSQSAFGSMSREVRSLLYRMQDLDEKKGFLRYYPTANVMELHKNLMAARSQGLFATSEEFINSLPEGIKAGLKRAIKKDPTLQTAIFRVYNKGEQDYGFFTFKNGKIYYESSYKDKSSSAAYLEYQTTYYQLPRRATKEQKDRHIFDHEGNIVTEKAKKFQQWLKKCRLIDDPNNPGTSIFVNENYTDKNNENYSCHAQTKDKKSPGRKEVIEMINDSLGLKFGQEEIDRFLTDDQAFYWLLYDTRQIANKFVTNLHIKLLFEDTNKYFWSIFKYAKPLAVVSKRKMVDKKARKKGLAFDDGFRYNKSTYFPHVVKNYIMDLFEDIKRGVNELNKLRYLMNNPVMEKNMIAQEVSKNSSDAHTFASSLTRLLGDQDTPFEKFTEADNLRLLIADNVTHFTLTDTNRKYVRVPMFITGDSNADRVFLLPMLNKDEIDDRLLDVLQSEVLRMEQFQAIEATVTEREKLAGIQKTENGEIKHTSLLYGNVHKNADKFTFLTFLNEKNEQTEALKKSLINILYPGDINTQGDKLKETLAQVLFGYYKEHPKDFSNLFKNAEVKKLFVGESGIISQNFRDGYTTFNQTLQDCGIINSEGQSSSISDLSKAQAECEKSLVGSYLENLYFNLRFYNIQQLQFLTGDVGFYDNTENMQKRFKEMIASGDPIDITAKFPDGSYVWQNAEDMKNGNINKDIRQNVVYVQQQKVSIKEMFNPEGKDDNPFKKLYDVGNGKETKASLTDGQAWRSFTSYRKILAGLGKWTEAHERVYQIIDQHRKQHKEAYDRGEIVPLTKDELNEILATGVIFQPLKPYYFGFDIIEYEDMASGKKKQAPIPVQHKYSEFPLIPELIPVKNSNADNAPINKLAAMGLAMEQENIDLICDSSCVKVGCFGEVNIDACTDVVSFRKTFRPDEKIAEEDPQTKIKTEKTVPSNKLIHSLPLHNWREQSNQPAHNDVNRALGTQLTYHAYANLDGMHPTHYPSIERMFPKNADGRRIIKLTDNVELDITEGFDKEKLVKLLNFLLGSGYVKSAAKLISDFSTIEKVGKQLSDIALRDDRTGYDKVLGFEIGENNDFLVPVNEASTAWDNCAAILSQIRKKIVKRGMKGGSAIQVSPYGFDDVLDVHVDSQNNMIVSDCAMVFDITVKGPNGEPVELNYTDYVDGPTGMMLGYEVGPDGKVGTTLKPVEPAAPQEGVKGREFYGWNTKLVQDYGDILSLIAYRIPTEKEYSILKLQVKRFFPKTTGGIIMVPSIFTQVAGFDFDIDKLYFIRKAFGFELKESATNKRVWEDIYTTLKNNPNTKPLYDMMIWFQQQAKNLDVDDSVIEATREINAEISRLEDILKNLTVYPQEFIKAGNITNLFSKLEVASERVITYIDKNGEERQMSFPSYRLSGRVNDIQTNLENRQKIIEKQKEELNKKLAELRAKRTEIYNNTVEGYNGEKVREYYTLARQALLESSTTKDEVKAAVQQLPATDTGLFKEHIEKNVKKYGENSITLDPTKPLFDQSQAVINNLFFQVLSERLSSPDTLNERTTPGGPWMHKRVKPLMMAIRYGLKQKSLQQLRAMINGQSTEQALKEYAESDFQEYSPQYDPTDPLTIVHYQTYNALYDRLIGIAANQNINQRLTAICKEYILSEGSLSFGSMLESGVDAMGKDIQATMIDGRDTELIVTEFLSGAVDAVKDALLEFFGISDDNFNIVCCLAKLGASAQDLGLLFNQPVVIEALKIMQKKKKLGLQSALKEALYNMEKQYAPKGTNETPTFISSIEETNKQNKVKYDATYVTTEKLCRAIIQAEINEKEAKLPEDQTTNAGQATNEERRTAEDVDIQFLSTQAAVVHLLQAAQEPATSLSDQINVTKTTSIKTLGSTPGSVLALIDRMIAFSSSLPKQPFNINTSVDNETAIPVNPFASVSNRESGKKILEENLNNAFGLSVLAYAGIRGAWDNIICKLFPYGRLGYRALVNSLKVLSKKDYFSDEIYDDIIRDGTLFFSSQLFSIFENKEKVTLLDADNKEFDVGVKSSVFYPEYFPSYFYGLTKYYKDNDEFNSIPLLQCIEIEGGKKGNRKPRLKFRQMSGSEKVQRDKIIESWNMMMRSEDPKIRALADHLIKYSFFMSGYTYSTSNFLSTLSTEAKVAYTGDNNFSPQEDEITYANMFNALFGIEIEDTYNEYTGRRVSFVTKAQGAVEKRASVKSWLKLFLKHNARKYYQFATTVYPNSEVEKSFKFDESRNSFVLDLSNPTLDKYRERFVTATEYDDESGLKPVKIWFKPCIIIGDKVYICDNAKTKASGDPDFTSVDASNPQITYYLAATGTLNGKDYSQLDPTASTSPDVEDLSQAVGRFIELGSTEAVEEKEKKEIVTLQEAWQNFLSRLEDLQNIIANCGTYDGGVLKMPERVLQVKNNIETFKDWIYQFFEEEKYQEIYDKCTINDDISKIETGLKDSVLGAIPSFIEGYTNFVQSIQKLGEMVGKEKLGMNKPVDLRQAMGLNAQKKETTSQPIVSIGVRDEGSKIHFTGGKNDDGIYLKGKKGTITKVLLDMIDVTFEDGHTETFPMDFLITNAQKIMDQEAPSNSSDNISTEENSISSETQQAEEEQNLCGEPEQPE